MTLFQNEKLITESDERQVILTTHRICYNEKSGGNLLHQHIMLEHVTSTEVTKTSNSFLLSIIALAVLAGLMLSVYSSDKEIAFGCWIFALILLVIYIATRKKTIIIGSPSTKIKIVADNMSTEKIFEFINKVENAIVNRTNG